jgi:hypothetical protein
MQLPYGDPSQAGLMQREERNLSERSKNDGICQKAGNRDTKCRPK